MIVYCKALRKGMTFHLLSTSGGKTCCNRQAFPGYLLGKSECVAVGMLLCKHCDRKSDRAW